MSEKKIKIENKGLLIFDLDGTVADTLPTIARAVNLCAEKFSFPQKTLDEVRLAVGNGVDLLLQRTMPSEAMSDGVKRAEIRRYFDACYEQTQAELDCCYEGMAEVMRELYSDGYILAVLSNKPDKLVKMIIKNLFPDGIISFSAGQTDMPKKPDPTVPLAIAESFGASLENSYFIGDSEVDVLTGRNAGMRTVAVSWGFRDRKILEEASPDVIVDSRAELLNYFKNLA